MSLDLGFDLPSRLILSKPPVLLAPVGSWTPLNCTLASNAVAAPDGTTTASTLTATGAATALAEPASFAMLGGVSYAFSAYLSSAAGVWAYLQLTDNGANAGAVWFDANGGVVGTSAPAGTVSIVTASIKAAAGSFFLATAILKSSGAIATTFPLLGCVNSNGGATSTASQVVNAWHPTLQPLT